MITSLAYLGFESPQFDQWRSFGPEIFGFGLSPDSSEDAVLLRMDSRHHRIAVRPGPTDRLDYIGWELSGPAAFEEVVDRLSAAGHKVETASSELLAERRVVGLASVLDPAGYRHELAYGQYYQPGTFAAGRAHGGFVAEEKGVGHVVVVAPTTPEYRGFLIDCLGFQVYAEYPVKFGAEGTADVLFVRCNGRTHCMAVIPLPGMSGVHHVEIEAKNMVDVGLAYDLVQERGVPVTMSLGSHTIDPVISFYCRTPSGFDLEFAYGGIEVDEKVIIGKPDRPDLWGHKMGSAGLQTTIVALDKPS